jgi:hypothetical protein
VHEAEIEQRRAGAADERLATRIAIVANDSGEGEIGGRHRQIS